MLSWIHLSHFEPSLKCFLFYLPTSQMVSTMKEMNLAIESSTWALVIATCSRRGRHKLAEDYFDIMLECGVEPTPFTWTALVQAKARGKNPFTALCRSFKSLYPLSPLFLFDLPVSNLSFSGCIPPFLSVPACDMLLSYLPRTLPCYCRHLALSFVVDSYYDRMTIQSQIVSGVISIFVSIPPWFALSVCLPLSICLSLSLCDSSSLSLLAYQPVCLTSNLSLAVYLFSSVSLFLSSEQGLYPSLSLTHELFLYRFFYLKLSLCHSVCHSPPMSLSMYLYLVHLVIYHLQLLLFILRSWYRCCTRAD